MTQAVAERAGQAQGLSGSFWTAVGNRGYPGERVHGGFRQEWCRILRDV